MTWEWSHTPEAYAAAERNLHRLPVDELRVIWAEWEADKPTPDPDWPGDWLTGFDDDRYHEALTEAGNLDGPALIGAIWEKASEQRSCTNGGHEAHLCPYGCGPHLVAFDDHASGNDYCGGG